MRYASRLVKLAIPLLCATLLAACANTHTRQETEAEAERAKQKPAKIIDPAVIKKHQEAKAALQAGDPGKAITILRKLAVEHPELPGPQINLGILMLQEEDLQGAEEVFRALLMLQPANPVANQQLGLILRQQGRFSESESAYLAALEGDPDYPLAHRNLGILYDLYLQQPAEALQHYQQYQALNTTPDKEVAKWIIDLERRVKPKQAK
jgi:Flp pilus assembly protein TadD